jgi:hypothetical protein
VYLGSHGVGLLTWGVGWCEVWHGHLFLMPVWCGVGRAVLWVLVRPSSRAYTTARRCAVSMADHRPSWLDVGTRIEVQWDIVTDEDEQSFVECVCPSLTSPNRSVVDATWTAHDTHLAPLSPRPIEVSSMALPVSITSLAQAAALRSSRCSIPSSWSSLATASLIHAVASAAASPPRI